MALEKKELQFFHKHLAQALYDLDSRVYYDPADDIGDDGFLYARCFVIATGREVYQRTLSNLNLMPDWSTGAGPSCTLRQRPGKTEPEKDWISTPWSVSRLAQHFIV